MSVGHEPWGAVRTAMKLRKEGRDMGHYREYGMMESTGLVEDAPAKFRQHERVGHERACHNAMRHADWHATKAPRMKVDGPDQPPRRRLAERCRRGAVQGTNSENVAATLRRAVSRIGAPAATLPDNGSCFVGRERTQEADQL